MESSGLCRPLPDPEVARLVSGLGVELDGLSGQELADRLGVIESVMRRAEAAVVAVLGEAQRRGVWRADGHASLRGWTAATVRWSNVQLRDRLRLLRLGQDVPVVVDALSVGAVGLAQVAEMARVRANPRCGDEFAATVAGGALARAMAKPFVEFRVLCRRWEQLHDGDGAGDDHEAAHAGRRVTLAESGGTFWLNGQFGAAQGAALAEVLDRFAQAELESDWAELRERVGDGAGASQLARSAGQRRADALYAMAVRAAGATGGASGAPLVNIVVDDWTFHEALTGLYAGVDARPTGGDWRDEPPPRLPTPACPDVAAPRPAPAQSATVPPWPWPWPWGEPAAEDRRCETVDGVVLDPHDVVAAALNGQVRRVVVDTAGVVINLGRRRRLFTGSARHAALVRIDAAGSPVVVR